MAKRSFLSWVGVVAKWAAIGLVGLVVIVLAIGSTWEAMQRHDAHQRFKPRGQIVDIGGGRHMHIDCRGQGAPTVVLEAGLDTNGTQAWSAVQDQIATFTRVCSYDRAGIQWSDDKPGVHDGEGVAHDLHALLGAAGEKGPYVMVGHSLGGPYIMTYVRFYPNDVAGVVFVDASHPDQNKLMAAAGISAVTKPIPLAYQILARMSWSGVPRILLNAASKQAANEMHVPAAAQAESNAFGPQSLSAALEEGKELNVTLAEAGKLRTLGDRPLVVLVATKALPPSAQKAAGLTPSQYVSMQAIWLKLHDDETSWSTHSRQQLVPDSTHYIQFGRPDIVIAAVKEVVNDVRAGPTAAKAPVKPK
jgi:pimeloyl-ACP methyl ester carboxylesterase